MRLTIFGQSDDVFKLTTLPRTGGKIKPLLSVTLCKQIMDLFFS